MNEKAKGAARVALVAGVVVPIAVFCTWGMIMLIGTILLNFTGINGGYREHECTLSAKYNYDNVDWAVFDRKYNSAKMADKNIVIFQNSAFWSEVDVGDVVYVTVSRAHIHGEYRIVGIRTEDKVYLDHKNGWANQQEATPDGKEQFYTVMFCILGASVAVFAVSVPCALVFEKRLRPVKKR